MKERPLVMRPELVTETLKGRKTLTTRLVKDGQPAYPDVYDCLRREFDVERMAVAWWHDGAERPFDFWRCPYGIPGDRLWVRERHSFKDQFKASSFDGWKVTVEYSDFTEDVMDAPSKVILRDPIPLADGRYRQRPSIHMPRWASRLTLKVEEIRVVRLQDITEEEALAEGMEAYWGLPKGGKDLGMFCVGNRYCDYAQDAYRLCIIDMHGEDVWDSNPWAWRIRYRKLETK